MHTTLPTPKRRRNKFALADGIVMAWLTKLAHTVLLLLPKKMCPSGINLPTSRVAYELILAEWQLSEFQHA